MKPRLLSVAIDDAENMMDAADKAWFDDGNIEATAAAALYSIALSLSVLARLAYMESEWEDPE